MEFNLLISTLIGGGLALLAFLTATNATSVNRKANFCFSIFCLLWASFWLDEMIDPDFLAANFALAIVLKVAQFLVGMAFYVSVRFYTNPDFKLMRCHLKFLIAPTVFLVLLLNRSASNEFTYNLLYLILFLGHSLAYVLLSYAMVLKHQRTIRNFASNTEAIDLRWIKYIIYSFFASLLIVILYNIFQMSQPLNVYINFYLLSVVYLVAFWSLRQKEIFPRGLSVSETLSITKDSTIETSAEGIRKNKLMDDLQMLSAKENLVRLMESERLYLDAELNLLKLADRLDLTTHQLSYVINAGLGENFFSFINRYRVLYASELLSDSSHDDLTIVAIGFDSGFNSKTAFNTTFKRFTSQTPTEFRKMRSNFENNILTF